MKALVCIKVYFILAWDLVYGKGNVKEGWLSDSIYHVFNADDTEMTMPISSEHPGFEDSYLSRKDYRDVYKIVSIERKIYLDAQNVTVLAVYDRTVHHELGCEVVFGKSKLDEYMANCRPAWRGPCYASPDVF